MFVLFRWEDLHIYMYLYKASSIVWEKKGGLASCYLLRERPVLRMDSDSKKVAFLSWKGKRFCSPNISKPLPYTYLFLKGQGYLPVSLLIKR